MYHRFKVVIHTLIIIMYVIHLPSQTRMMNQRNLIEKSPSSQIYSSSMDCALRVRADCGIIYIHGTGSIFIGIVDTFYQELTFQMNYVMQCFIQCS